MCTVVGVSDPDKIGTDRNSNPRELSLFRRVSPPITLALAPPLSRHSIHTTFCPSTQLVDVLPIHAQLIPCSIHPSHAAHVYIQHTPLHLDRFFYLCLTFLSITGPRGRGAYPFSGWFCVYSIVERGTLRFLYPRYTVESM